MLFLWHISIICKLLNVLRWLNLRELIIDMFIFRPKTFEQVEVPKRMFGSGAAYLTGEVCD